ncbi:4011_t:CDS:2 [Entrophospora sp. SA101]|nr:4011_t:CDS:2 [Entrophospora sp. SA101]
MKLLKLTLDDKMKCVIITYLDITKIKISAHALNSTLETKYGNDMMVQH